MALSDIVDVQITAATLGLTRAGFGIPLILGTPSWATDRIRFYSSIAGVGADFVATRPEYLAAAAIFNQPVHPQQIAIGRLALKPTQKWTVTSTVADSTAYTITINGTVYSITSGVGATATSICDALRTAIGVTGLTDAGTTTLTLTATTAGDWFSVAAADPALLSVVQDHVDPGVATDLAAILLADSTWYAFINPWNSQAMAVAAAAWAETNKRLFLCDSQDGRIVTTSLSTDVALGASGTVAAVTKTAADAYTAVTYHPDNGSMIAAAWAGAVLPLDPGSETWAFKNLHGVAAYSMTDNQRTNLLAKKANYYATIAGVNHTQFGTVASGEYIDVIRLIDWTKARMAEDIFSSLVNNPKVPFTDSGIALVESKVRAVLQEGVKVGGYASYTTHVPKASEVSSADKTARFLRNVNFAAILAGAVHTVRVTGTVSV